MIENLEPTVLVWLAVSEDRFDINYQKEFRKSINCLMTFTDPNQCESYIRQSCSNATQVVLIMDKQFINDFLRQIHDIREVSSIYIFNESKEELDIKFSKVSHTFVSLINL
jgi:hypothetical protein